MVWCVPKKRRIPVEDCPFSVDCAVTHAIDAALPGSIACVCRQGTPPYLLEVVTEQGEPVLDFVRTNDHHVFDVKPGVYCVLARDFFSRTAECIVEVGLTSLPVVTSYRVTHASSDQARDGKIQVLGRNLRSRSFLWTNGVVTSSPELRDVSPGTYTATPFHEDDFPFIHACPPAVVLPSQNAQVLQSGAARSDDVGKR